MQREAFYRIRGSGIAAVLYLIETRQLAFNVVSTKHHGRDLFKAAIAKIADNESLLDALVYARALRCGVTFRHGHTIDIMPLKREFLVGVDSEPDEIIKWIAGSDLERTMANRHQYWLWRIRTIFRKCRRAA